jgi:hypothetical protein
MPHDFYVSWAALYEGSIDEAYLGQLIPRLMGEIVLNHGNKHVTIPPDAAVILQRKIVEVVAKQACAARDAFHIIFIHADTGGRGQETNLDLRSTQYCEAMYKLCYWPPLRCVAVSPRHETEAWMLADPHAVTEALGYHGAPNVIGLPADAAQAERLVDPKAVLAAAMAEVRGRRRSPEIRQIIPAIVQRQSFVHLRQSASFTAFEAAVRAALADLGAI